MRASILSIGTELTTGQTIDTNAGWLAAELTGLGFRITEHATVGDELEPIAAAIRRMLDGCDIVILTGGLGPTPDDLTREALAEAIGRPLEENAEAADQIHAFFARLDRTVHRSNLRQAMMPRGCAVIRNESGTAPGILFRSESAVLFALPGVPDEMKAMFRKAIVPELQAGSSSVVAVRHRLNCFGMSEAKIGELLGEFMARGRNPLVGTTASHGTISIRIVARGESASEAESLLRDDVGRFRKLLGTVVFGEGEDSLESVVGELLRRRGETLATAESCTGGLLAKRLTDIPGSSGYFLRGFVTYSNDAKIAELGVPAEMVSAHGAVSEEVAGALASGCRTISGSDYALSTTGIAGPTGGGPPDKPVGLVYVGLADEGGVVVRRLVLGDYLDRMEIRNRACHTALNLLRLRMTRSDRK